MYVSSATRNIKRKYFCIVQTQYHNYHNYKHLKNEGQCIEDMCRACNVGTTKKAVYEDATALIVHAAMRRSLFHMTSELEDRTDKSLRGVMLSFASHTTRNARKVLQYSAADETGTRRRLDCDQLLWQT
jgi:hypothetical protein